MNLDKLNIKNNTTSDLVNKSLEELYYIYDKANSSYKRSILFGCGAMIGSVPGLNYGTEVTQVLLSFFLGCVFCKGIIDFLPVLNLQKNQGVHYRNSQEYLAAYKSYKIILEEISKLCKELEWDNEMKIFAGYGYLLKQGYLSKNHKFYYSVNSDCQKDLYGSSIIDGMGNCKNINSMLRDILRENNYCAHNLSMILDNCVNAFNNIAFLYDDSSYIINLDEQEIELESEKKLKFITNFIEKFVPNHLVTLFNDETHSYVMDATNDTLFFIDDKLNLYHGKYKFDMYYRSFDNEGEKRKLNQILKPSSIELLQGRLDDYYDTLKKCHVQTHIFEQFYNEHKDLYKEVAEKSKTLKKTYDRYRY